MPRYFITTAIDYPNGLPHIGHAYEKVLADAHSIASELLADVGAGGSLQLRAFLKETDVEARV